MPFLLWHILHEVRIKLFCGTFALRTELTFQLRFVFCSSIWRVFCYVIITFFICFYVLYVVTFFDDVRNTFYFATFELRMEITLHLRFVLVPHFKEIFITSQLWYLFARCSYVFWWCHNFVIFCYVRITYGSYITRCSVF